MSGSRILVCDDTPAKRYVLASWLRRGGFDVVESGTAAEAEELMRTEAVDLAVLDVHLTDGSGLDVTRLIRSDPALASTPVVHVSAIARETSDKVNALDEGADAYLIDPIDPEELLSTVRALLRSSGARREAEQLASRLTRLSRAAVRLNVASSVPRLAEATSRAAADVVRAPAFALLLDDRGEGWRASATGSGVGNAAAGLPADLARTLLAGIEEGGQLSLDAGWTEHLPVAAGAWIGAPIRIDDQVAGVVAGPVLDGGGAEDRPELLLERLAQAATIALENLRALEFEHRTAVTLQRSLLPSVLPEPDGLALAARYRASHQRMEVGGDFFDAFEVEGACFLVIGDVQGHSLEAALVMGELRYSLRAYAHEGHSPSAILDLLDVLLERTSPDLTATILIARVDRERRSADIVSAGHLAPLRVRRGQAEHLELEGTMLGIGLNEHPSTTVSLEPGDRLVFYTDGLVERRDLLLDLTVDHLVHQVESSSWASTNELANELLATWSTGEDDLAVLVIDVLP